MRADMYLTNLSEKMIAVGMTQIGPGKTEKILEKDFERKASYIGRMIKEKKLSFAVPEIVDEVSAPAKAADEDVSSEGAPAEDTNATNEATAGEETTSSDSEPENTEAQSSEADASDATEDVVETEETKEEEASAEPEVVEDVPAPTRKSKK